ncbi:MAG TPA: sulfatase-like hydrolase/transferase [Rhodanobacteraceae bacterium]|nr:sulfatase-like hydrolase/transferase [Rhodanobacteraceae bacterium]
MPIAAVLPRRTRIVTYATAACFLALLVCGPLIEASLSERLFSTALVFTAVVLTAFVTRRPAFALALPTVVFGSILIASVIKYHYLATPLLAPDLIYSVNRDLLEVALHYPSILASLIAGVILIPGLLILVWRLDQPLFLSQVVSARERRWIRTLGACATIPLLISIDSPAGPFSTVFEKGMWQTMNDRSYIADFFASFYQTTIRIPALAPDADGALSWTQDATENPPGCTTKACATQRPMKSPQEHPDIISVLEESTYDPAMLALCTLPLCKHKMFQPDGRTRAHGFLTVHVWGGGTWTSEFSLLTGLDHQTFGDAGLYAPYNLAPRVVHTLPDVLHAAGYRVIAVYPMSGDFINARNAYKFYGFDKFYDGQDYGLSWHSSDSDLMQVFDRIYADEKKAIGNQPLFVMMLTLRQHGPHMTPLVEQPQPYDKPLFPGKFKPKDLDDWINLNLGNYLYRLDGSDAAITHLEKILLDSDRPTVLFHFGDHQPSFEGAMRVLDKVTPKAISDANFVTYYMLKSNYRPARNYDYPALDISFAGALLLDVAGVKKDDFFAANALMRERCDGFYLNCTDKRVLDSYQNYVFHELGVLHE